jgi:hypothetical protein
MRNRITVRADNVELRGYFDGDMDALQEFSQNMAPVGMVIASLEDDDWDPFAPAPITHPEDPPTIEASREVISNIALNATGAVDFMDQIAHLHYSQALVIRGERARADKAEASDG